MLYFVFNEELVCVLVAHDPSKDEYVCQIPIFPPFQSLQDFPESKLHTLLHAALCQVSLKFEVWVWRSYTGYYYILVVSNFM